MSTNQRVVFVNNLCRYMKARSVDQSDIVNALGISASTVSDWVNGKKYPRVDAMQRLADYLGVLLSDLTTEQIEERTKLDAELITIYRGLNAQGRADLLRQARYLDSDPDMKQDGESKSETA